MPLVTMEPKPVNDSTSSSAPPTEARESWMIDARDTLASIEALNELRVASSPSSAEAAVAELLGVLAAAAAS
jgi:hypothetical protein